MMFLLLLFTFLSNVIAEEICFGKFCLEESYDKNTLPAEAPVRVEVSPMLSEVFRVNDNDFSITFEAMVTFNWVEQRLKFRNMSEMKDGEYGDVNPDILDHLWIPPVQIRHMEKAVTDEKGLFPQRLLNIFVNNGDILLQMGVNTKPTITCKMRFNWYPFDEQICKFMVQSIPDTNHVRLVNIMDPKDFFSPDYTEIALLDYELKLEHLPEESLKLDLGSGFDNFKDFHKTSTVSWSQTGFQIHLTRRWARYIFLYYIPSSLCVFASWASFLIDLDVLAGRSGLLVTLFLSLTALLASTILSSPRVGCITALTTWIIIQYAFITLAIAAFAFILVHKRYSKLSKEELKEFQKKLDTRFLISFIIAYFTMFVLYWIIIAYTMPVTFE